MTSMLSPSALAMLSEMGQGHRYTSPSLRALCGRMGVRCGMGREEAVQALRELVAAGYATYSEQAGMSLTPAGVRRGQVVRRAAGLEVHDPLAFASVRENDLSVKPDVCRSGHPLLVQGVDWVPGRVYGTWRCVRCSEARAKAARRAKAAKRLA